MSAMFLLFESALGMALFERVRAEVIGMGMPQMRESVNDFQRFKQMVKLKGALVAILESGPPLPSAA